MQIDVSEIKTYRECERKWALSSRNAYHLQGKTPVPALRQGTIFHECLHSLYLGGSLDKILDMAVREALDDTMAKQLWNMVNGYYEKNLVKDFAEYQIIDIEYRFNMEFDEIPGVVFCGSIDMITLSKLDGKIYGFEHKTAAKFRPAVYNMVDEQPQMYTLALQRFCAEHGYEYGGIFINQVQKLVKLYRDERTLCIYSDKTLANFLKGIAQTVNIITGLVPEEAICNPGYMKCVMCNFKNVCELYGGEDIILADMLEEFSEEFEVRTVDHLDEKTERYVD